MGFRLYAGGILAVVGGVLMVGSGYTSRGFLYAALGYAEPHVSDFLSGAAASAAMFATTILELTIELGGLTVLVGGLFIFAHHTTVGRTLIYLGGGAGFLGLLISFGYSAYRLGGLGPALSYLPYWVGLSLAIGSRRIVKGA